MKRLLWAAVLVGCTEKAPPAAELKELSGHAARVGPELVGTATVARVAGAQNLSLGEARERAIFDALFAAAARDELDPSAVRSAENQALAWALHDEIARESQNRPITAEEVAAFTARHFTRYDRPESFRTIHAVALVEPNASPAEHENARAAAERIRAAVEAVALSARERAAPALADEEYLRGGDEAQRDPIKDDFEAAAKAAAGEARLRVEMLPPVAADGTVVATGAVPRNRAFDIHFASATAKLRARGDLSPVVATPFGYHVILLLGVLPEKRVPEPQRRKELAPEIVRERAASARKALIERLTRERGAALESNHAALLELVRPRADDDGARR